jgi:hypothetical protein
MQKSNKIKMIKCAQRARMMRMRGEPHADRRTVNRHSESLHQAVARCDDKGGRKHKYRLRYVIRIISYVCLSERLRSERIALMDGCSVMASLSIGAGRSSAAWPSASEGSAASAARRSRRPDRATRPAAGVPSAGAEALRSTACARTPRPPCACVSA